MWERRMRGLAACAVVFSVSLSQHQVAAYFQTGGSCRGIILDRHDTSVPHLRRSEVRRSLSSSSSSKKLKSQSLREHGACGRSSSSRLFLHSTIEEGGSMDVGKGIRASSSSSQVSSAEVSDEAQSLKASVKAKDTVPFVLRRGRPHELDLLAILSTEAFTPKGKWYEIWQNTKHLLMVWDLQAQIYNRFYNWRNIVKGFTPPIEESRYALLVASTASGLAVGMTELCVAPCPATPAASRELRLAETGPYLSNLAVQQQYRRCGIGQSLVRWCEELSLEWGHEVMYLHVDAANVKAITFYKNIGFASVERDSRWYVQIGREDMAEKHQLVLYKRLERTHSLKGLPFEEGGAVEGERVAYGEGGWEAFKQRRQTERGMDGWMDS